MAKDLCSLVIVNLKNITRIVGNNIVPAKGSTLVHFRDLNQLKLALKLQENNRIVIQTEIPADLLAKVDPVFSMQQAVVPVVEEVAEPVAEEVAAEEEVKPKKPRTKKNQ
jgi:hypothetical protein